MAGLRENARLVFLTRHGDVRSGWRILLFLLCLAAIGFVLVGGAGWIFGGIPAAAMFLGFVSTLLASWILTRRVNKKPLAAIGLWVHPRTARELGIGLLIGFLMMTGVFIIQLAAGYLTVTWRGLAWHEAGATVMFSLFYFASSAAGEELLFRGYPFQTLAQGITMLPAILAMSGLFGVAHMQNPHATVLSTVNVMLAGIWLSLAYLKTRGLWLPFGLHLSWNFAQTTVYGFPTSGFGFAEHRIWSTVQTGPEGITGGAFGPEGGILATLALVGGTWYIVKSKYLVAPEGIVTLDSVEDLLPPVSHPTPETKA